MPTNLGRVDAWGQNLEGSKEKSNLSDIQMRDDEFFFFLIFWSMFILSFAFFFFFCNKIKQK